MPIGIGNEQGAIVRGADGSTLYVGAAVVGQTYVIINGDSAAMAAGEAVRADLTNFWIGVPESVASGGSTVTTQQADSLKCLRVASAADVGFVGVTADAIPVVTAAGVYPTQYGQGTVYGPGSICGVKTTTAALTAGMPLSGSATAGLCAVTNSTYSTGYGTIVGTTLKINTTGATGTGSTSWAGILVSPR